MVWMLTATSIDGNYQESYYDMQCPWGTVSPCIHLPRMLCPPNFFSNSWTCYHVPLLYLSYRTGSPCSVCRDEPLIPGMVVHL